MSTVIEVPPKPKRPEHNWTGVDFSRPIPRPKVKGLVIDFHCHLDLYPNHHSVRQECDRRGMYILSVTTTLREMDSQRDRSRAGVITVDPDGVVVAGGR